MMTENDALMEIVHLASAALVADLTDVKRQALSDIADAIAAILPVEGKRREAEEQSGRAQTPAAPQGMAKLLTVAPGVQLVRFAGEKQIKLVARRVGSSGGPNTIFQILVSKKLRRATVMRENRILFEIYGTTCNYSMIEKCAVSALRRWFKNQRKNNAERRRKRKARLDILTPEQELARTVAEQKEGL